MQEMQDASLKRELYAGECSSQQYQAEAAGSSSTAIQEGKAEIASLRGLDVLELARAMTYRVMTGRK